MPMKRYKAEQIVTLLRQIEVVGPSTNLSGKPILDRDSPD
jgi:hypothetical protein